MLNAAGYFQTHNFKLCLKVVGQMAWFCDFLVALWRDSVSACSLGRCQRPTQWWLHRPKVASHTNKTTRQGGALSVSLTTADNNITVAQRWDRRTKRAQTKRGCSGKTDSDIEVCKVWSNWQLGVVPYWFLIISLSFTVHHTLHVLIETASFN